MAMICDGVVANMTSLYLAVIVAIKLCGFMTGRSFSGWFVIALSTFVMGCIFIAALTWDVSRKPNFAAAQSPDRYYLAGGGSGGRVRCRGGGGGICWHGVSVQSTVSQIRFQLPEDPLSAIPST